MKVLIVDDNQTNVEALEIILQGHGHDTVKAFDGFQAIESFEKENPDIILMDVMMPVMDGYDATREIKRRCVNNFTPVIFVTGLKGSDVLVKCVECGGDDFITKPYDIETMLAKIKAMERIRKLHIDLQLHQQNMQHELKLANHVFDIVLDQGKLDEDFIKYWISPVSLFSGDLVLCEHSPSGGIHIMLADFTGHGLSAAIGALPVSDIFYSMTKKGFSVGDIVDELNSHLYKILPVNMFCAACLLEIDSDRSTAAIWNGGMPDVYVTDASGIINRIPSAHPALGIDTGDTFSRETDIVPVQQGSNIYMYSDGLIEAKNTAGEKYGKARLESLFPLKPENNNSIELIIGALSEYIGGAEQTDDTTLVEVTITDKKSDSKNVEQNVSRTRTPSDWNINIEFEANILKEFNPVPIILNMIMDVQAPGGHRERLFIVISELFTNSLDHGLLGLDSAIKSTPEGFLKYFEEREERLSKLKQGSISVSLMHKPIDSGGELIIQITDDGKGFDYSAIGENLDANNTYCGRGISLVESLCFSLEYSNNGNRVEAAYRW